MLQHSDKQRNHTSAAAGELDAVCMFIIRNPPLLKGKFPFAFKHASRKKIGLL